MAAPARGSLARRTLSGHLLVATVTVLVAAGVALLVGPRIFHEHLLQAGHTGSPTQILHIERAFRDSSLLSWLAGLAVAMVCAGVATWWHTSRIRRTVDEVGQAAHEIADGRHWVRVPITGDATELDSLARSFNTMAERLEHTEETRRRLLTDVGHEVRTPVATLIAYLEGLQDGVTTWSPRTLELMRQQVDRLALLTRDLSAVSRAEEGLISLDRRPVRVGDILHAAEEASGAAACSRGIDLRVESSEALTLRVDVDPARLNQVLANLVANALRHTSSGGSVRLGATAQQATVTLEVTDDGEGIAPEHLTHIFERFYRADAGRSRDSAGSGIGLTISRAIVEAHGGTLTAESPGQGGGATFWIRLPRA